MLRVAETDSIFAPTSAPSRRSGPKTIGRPAGLTVWAAVLILWSFVLLALYTEGNRFPAPWHWDEPSKVEQLSGEPPNFHHPRLLLEATKAVLALQGAPSAQDIVVAGRYVSAASAVLTVDVLALLTLLIYGEAASLLAALLIGLNPLLYGLAHYMKEDTVYVLGIALFLLACMLYERRPTRSRLLALGVAAGVATSSKYLGAATVPIAIALVVWRSRAQGDTTRLASIKAAVTAMLAAAVFLALDWQMFADPSLFRAGLRGSVRQAALGDFGAIYRPMFSSVYLKGLIELCMPAAIAAFAGYVLLAVRSKGRGRIAELAIALLPVLYLIGLQISPSKRIRYELPPILLILMAAAVFLAYLAQREKRLGLRILALAAVLSIVGGECGSIWASRAALLDDSRARMASWIRTKLPPGAVIALSAYDGFTESRSSPAGPGDVPTKLVVALPNDGDLQGLRASGITHVLLSEMMFARYFNSTFAIDTKDAYGSDEVAQCRAFFRELFAHGVLVHHVAGAMPAGTFFSPELWLFDIRAGAERLRDGSQPLEPPTFTSLQD